MDFKYLLLLLLIPLNIASRHANATGHFSKKYFEPPPPRNKVLNTPLCLNMKLRPCMKSWALAGGGGGEVTKVGACSPLKNPQKLLTLMGAIFLFFSR